MTYWFKYVGCSLQIVTNAAVAKGQMVVVAVSCCHHLIAFEKSCHDSQNG